jgi:hypothetical protein
MRNPNNLSFFFYNYEYDIDKLMTHFKKGQIDC